MPDANEETPPDDKAAVPHHAAFSPGQPGRKDKVMVYVPPAVHRAMRLFALDAGQSASDVYAEAARAFLMARGMIIGIEPDQPAAPAPRAATMADLVAAIDRQGRRIEEIRAGIDDARSDARRTGPPPAGTKPAEAMKVVLGILRQAGAAGVGGRELDAAAYAAGVRSGAAETARAVLRGAGLVRCERKRWYVDGL